MYTARFYSTLGNRGQGHRVTGARVTEARVTGARVTGARATVCTQPGLIVHWVVSRQPVLLFLFFYVPSYISEVHHFG